ncbi:MAG: LptF/LptG family permease [Planctomycetota bacterium]|nr:LptF/LptG family permease [Planctomycetota bacterium]
MKTLDRYIVRLFLINFVILLSVLSLLFVVVNVLIDLDEYLEAGRLRGAEMGGAWLGTLYSILDYNAPMVVLLYVFFSGLVVVAAMGFTFAALYRTGELGAMVSSGISMYRVAASVLIAGFVLNCLSLPAQEFIIPRLAGKLVRDKSQVSLTTAKPFHVRYAVDSHGGLLSAAAFDPNTHKLTDVAILVRDADGLAERRVMAESADWSESSQGWKLQGGYAIRPRPELAGNAGTSEEVSFYATELSPEVLLARQASFFPRLLSLNDLEKLSHSTAIDTGQIRQIMHSRFSMLVVNMLILAMSLQFFMLREPANILLQGVKAAGLTMAAWGVGLLLLLIGGAELNPVATAWLPVVIYLPLSAIALLRVRT